MRLPLKDSPALQLSLLALLLILPPAAIAENRPVSIVPQPVQLVLNAGSFRLTPNTFITADKDSVSEARFLSRRLFPATGFPFEVRTAASKGTLAIDMRLDASLTKLGEEGYHLAVAPKGISICAAKTAGLFYAGQSLMQLLPPEIFREAKVSNIEWTIPSVQIEDYPRFKWRGALLDVGRHFMPKEFVKKFIDLLALQKMNTFHWHLTDDQGWRIEIKKYPKLTQVGAWRKETLIGLLEDESQKNFGLTARRTAASIHKTMREKLWSTPDSGISTLFPRSKCQAMRRRLLPPTRNWATPASKWRWPPSGECSKISSVQRKARSYFSRTC
jgi:hexosaminidase